MSASIPAAATTGTTSLAEVLDVSNAAFIPNDRIMLSQVDLNAGNKQIAHGIDRVLLPIKVSK